MTTLIFGVGVGLFSILTLWVLVALIFLISLRIERKIGWVCVIAILLVSAFTYILLKVPRASERPVPTDNKVYDRLFIWRIIILIVCFISSIISIVGYIKFGLVRGVRPVRITTWVLSFGNIFSIL
ncbi:PREDICTED: transmembrane protein 218-like [Trachymyrmex cornetzi]|uniref:transmembrane protein 218-like n=1 Tax=Trachymyrmex cornetzi TaxID=471704 RepID=UPI00084EDF4D|nr:PREDICTED: transmembrane protein 218-like [Trachymyrmex cornetzi]